MKTFLSRIITVFVFLLTTAWFSHVALAGTTYASNFCPTEQVWALKVQVYTANESGAGTDAKINFAVGYGTPSADRINEWNLDNSGNDREKNDTDTYTLSGFDSLYIQDIQYFQFFMYDSWPTESWKIGWFKVWVNNKLLFDSGWVNHWMYSNNKSDQFYDVSSPDFAGVPYPQAPTVNINVGQNQAVNFTYNVTQGCSATNVYFNPHHGTITGTYPNYTYTPVANYFGLDSVNAHVTYLAYNNTGWPKHKQQYGNTSDGTMNAQIAKNVTLPYNRSTQIDLNAPGTAQSTVYAIPTAPAFGTLTKSGSLVTYTPNTNFTGSDYFVALVSNGVTAYPQWVYLTVIWSNNAPTFTPANNPTVLEDSGAKTITGFVTGIGTGSAINNEGSQTLTFTTTNNNNGLFSVQPSIASNGTLTFTPAANAFGIATVTVKLQDNGGTANGGIDSTTKTFTITVTGVNDRPTFSKGTDQTSNEDVGIALNHWASASPGPNEAGQNMTFNVTTDNDALFQYKPAIYVSGAMTYTPAANKFGVAHCTVHVTDNGGTANGGIDTVSPDQTFTITILSSNDAPSFTKGSDLFMGGDTRAQNIVNWATNISPGPSDEAGQGVNFIVTNDSPSLFLAQPILTPLGALQFQPVPNPTGTATVTIQLHDSGGTANGGSDTSAAQTFKIIINPPPLKISEFRFRGPKGINDEFIEFYNASDYNYTVRADDGSDGFALVASDGQTRFVIPNGTVIPARAHYLATNSLGYSLNNAPGGPGHSATGDITYNVDIPTAPSNFAGIALFSTSNPANFTMNYRLDAAGYVTAPTLYREGTGFPIGGKETTQDLQYSFVRKISAASSYFPQDTDNNMTDFRAVEVDGTVLRSLAVKLGSPGPENLFSPIRLNENPIPLGVGTNESGVSTWPNYEWENFPSAEGNNMPGGFIRHCWTLYNNTNYAWKEARLRVVDLNTFPSGTEMTDVRIIDPQATLGYYVNYQGQTINFAKMAPEPGYDQSMGAGINSTIHIPGISTNTPFPPGGTKGLELHLGIQHIGTSNSGENLVMILEVSR